MFYCYDTPRYSEEAGLGKCCYGCNGDLYQMNTMISSELLGVVFGVLEICPKCNFGWDNEKLFVEHWKFLYKESNGRPFRLAELVTEARRATLMGGA